MSKLTVIMPAAGKGTRLNLPYPKEILRLNNMSMEQLHDWYWSMEEILIHNYNHYHKKFIPKQIQGFYNEFIFE